MGIWPCMWNYQSNWIILFGAIIGHIICCLIIRMWQQQQQQQQRERESNWFHWRKKGILRTQRTQLAYFRKLGPIVQSWTATNSYDNGYTFYENHCVMPKNFAARKGSIFIRNRGRNLGDWGDGPPKFEVGGRPMHSSPPIFWEVHSKTCIVILTMKIIVKMIYLILL